MDDRGYPTLISRLFWQKKNKNKKIKKYLSNCVCEFLKEHFRDEDKRKLRKFSFEEKFERFYKIMRDQRERNRDNRYGYLNPHDDKMGYVP